MYTGKVLLLVIIVLKMYIFYYSNFQKREDALLAVVNNLKVDLEKIKRENEYLKVIIRLYKILSKNPLK